MFSHLSVSHFVHGRCLPLVQGSLPHPLGQTPPPPWQTPPGRHPPGRNPPWVDPSGRHPPPCPVHAGMHSHLPSACCDTHPPTQCMLGYIPLPSTCWDTVNKRVIRIPLECILVSYSYRRFAPQRFFCKRPKSGSRYNTKNNFCPKNLIELHSSFLHSNSFLKVLENW